MAPPAIQKVLLVEDEESGIVAAKSFFVADEPELEGSPPQLLIARDAQEFEARVQEHGASLDVIVTDILLGSNVWSAQNETGLDVFLRLRAMVPDVPCIAVTGYAPDHEAIKAIRAGIGDYVKKPFDWFDLWQIVKDKVAISRLQKSLRAFHATISEITRHLRDIESLNVPALRAEIVRQIISVAVLATRAEGGWIFLARGNSGPLALEQAVGYPHPTLSPGARPGLYENVFRTGREQCLFIERNEEAAGLAPFERDKRSLLAAPLVVDGRRLGVIEVARGDGEPCFHPNDVALLTQFGQLAAMAVEAREGGIRVSDLLLRVLRRGLEHDAAARAMPLPAIDSAYRELLQETCGEGNGPASRALDALQRIRRLGSRHLEFWSDCLDRYAREFAGRGERP